MTSNRRTPEEIRALLTEKVPAGTVVAEHTENEHWYRHTPSGVLLPSVTTIGGILQAPHLKRWAATVTVDYLEERLSQIDLTPGAIVTIPADLRKSSILAHEDIFEDAGDIGTQGHDVVERYLKAWIETGIQPEDITKYIIGQDHRLWAISRSAEQFMHDYLAIPIAPEFKVAYVPKKNPENTGFAGTLDALMWIAFPVRDGQKQLDGMGEHKHNVCQVGSDPRNIECFECGAKWRYYFTLVDWKTSNSIRDHSGKGVKIEYAMQVSSYWKALKQMLGFAPERILIVRLDKHQMKYELIEVLKPAKAYQAFANLRRVYAFMRTEPKDRSIVIGKNELINLNDLSP